MEPTSYGNRDRMAPLRQSPPRARATHYANNASPLRLSPQTNSPNSNIFQNEDDRYEQRRQEELRRQIRVKEKELEQISSSKERFKQRIERTLGLTGSYPEIPRPNDTTISKKHASPLRHMQEANYSQPSSYIADSRERYSQPQRTNGQNTGGSPLRATVKRQEREPPKIISQFQATTPNPKPQAPRINSDYANQLQNDNQQLQRRLNLVVAELDRVNREKLAAQHRLAQTASETDHLLHQIQGEERDDKHLHEMNHELIHSKEENRRVQGDIKFTDQLRTESLNRLRILQAERERRVANCEDISEGLVKKLSVMKDLEREINISKLKIDDIQRQLPALERQNHVENHSIHDIHLIIERLVRERDELMNKLQHLNLTYDQTVAEISRERAQLESHNKRHTQLLTSKVIFQALESMVLARKQASLNEFFNYCKFDEKCHKTLKTLAGVLLRCGFYQMRVALKKWFQTALEPVSVIKQGKDLLKSYRNRVNAIKDFNNRTGKAATAAEIQQHKQEACKAIFAIKSLDVWKECCRYFTIWRDKMRLMGIREERLGHLISRQISNRKRQAVDLWRSYSLYVNDLVRCHVLRKSFAHDQMLLITFNQLKFATTLHKRIRLMRLKHLFKAWQDSNAYRKYMMGQIVMAANLKRTLKNKILAHCFDMLRYNKESEKYQLVNDKLSNDTAPAISHTTVYIGDESAKSLRNEKLRKLRALARQVDTRVASYFYHWKQVTDAYRVFLLKNVHEILLRKYQETTHQAFNRWMNGVNWKNNGQQQVLIDDQASTNSGLGKDITSLAKEIQTEVQRQQTRARVKLTRGCDIFARRMQRRGLRKWRAQCQMMTDKERAANYLCNLVRISRLKAAWRLYLRQVLQKRQDDKDNARALFYRQTRDARIMRKHFNALCVFTNNFKKSKTYWSIVLNKMDVWMKRRTFLRWIDNSHLTRVQQLTGIQCEESNDFDNKNSKLNKGQNTLQEKDHENQLLKADLHRKAQRGMSNYFARLYYTRLQARFLKWKQAVVDMKHRELLMRKFAEHWRNHRFYFIKAAFKNWIHKAKCHETKVEIRQTKIAGDEQHHVNTFKEQQHFDTKTQLDQEIAIQDAEASLHGARAQYILSAIIRKNDVNHYQSNKRYIFGVWVAHIQRQKRFVVAINNVLRKSCLQQGLDNINAFSRDKNLCRGQNHAFNYFRRMFFKFQIGGAFAKWRTYRLDAINNNRKDADTDRMRRTSKHSSWVQKCKDTNCLRVYNVLRRFRLHSLMKGWKNVTRWQRAQKVCTKQKADQWLAYNTRRALKKWFERKQLTIKVRGHFNQFEAWKARYYKQACFNQLKVTQNNSKAFCTRLSELAKKYDNRNLLSAFYTIKNFRTSKDNAYSRQKKQASTGLINVLQELYLRKMAANMSDLRVQIIKQKRRSLQLLGLLNQRWMQKLRRNFFKWKYGQERASAVIEVNEEGPVVEIVLDEEAQYYNLKGFMSNQGYRKFEIDDVVAITKDKAQEGVARSIARWKAYKGANSAYLKPKMFDRWVAFVKFRKLMRYHLKNMLNKLQPVKADLSISFNRWKYMTGKSHAALNGLDKSVLVAKCADNYRKVNQLEQRTNETEEYLGHMGMQRNELVENYMKSQRLAIALGRDNLERGMAKGVAAMSDNMNAQKRSHFEEILQRNIHLIANLKDKIKDFEVDNESLANENEELRQFSLDGYQIAKNVQSLSNERERLSVDLADKATTIKKLLDENEGLSIRLREAQQNAARLIQQSSHNLRVMQRQSSAAGYF